MTIDVAFRVTGRCLPVEHAYSLSRAVQQFLTWFSEEPDAGLHLIHVAESGNGWVRPDPGELLHLSKRTRLTLRVPEARLADTQLLSGSALDVDGHEIMVGGVKTRTLSPARTLFSRHVVGSDAQTETQFMSLAAEMLKNIGIVPGTLMCGRASGISTPGRKLLTRSVLAAGLAPAASLTLQNKGLGPERKLGCGLFVPHKGIDSLIRAEQD